ncbi:Apyrase [Teladorsagia circumcincta]|uniref:Apyrase n=1 Tax=Teladorsagia circumcincta TaxID=45464 RepID=A0A2G9UYJ3_TELCI|nr:Apyrase [Teladorsagia circumcincta]
MTPQLQSRPTVHQLPDGSTEYELLIVTDMDRNSRAGEWTWRAVTREGRLTLSPDMAHVSIKWDENSERNLTSSMNIKGRAMELSDLSVFHNRILTPDDRTGLISEIKDNKMIPWVFLNSGPGNTTSPFKCEWMTIKNDVLYVGGHGNEFRNKQGEIVHRDNMWIKTITPDGEITYRFQDSLANAFSFRFPIEFSFPLPFGTPSSPDITYDDYPDPQAKPPHHHGHDHHKPKPPQSTIPHVRVYPDGSTEYELLIVTDLDKASRAGEWLWRAVSRRGRLTLNRGRTHVNISWELESEHNLTS